MYLYSKAVYYSEWYSTLTSLQDTQRAIRFMQKAYEKNSVLLESTDMYNFSNMSKIRLYYSKLLIQADDSKGAKCLLLDNVRDCQCELMVRYSRRVGTPVPDMKIIKCVSCVHPVQDAHNYPAAARKPLQQ